MQGDDGLGRIKNRYTELLFKNVSIFDTDTQPKQNPDSPTPLTQNRRLAASPAKKVARTRRAHTDEA